MDDFKPSAEVAAWEAESWDPYFMVWGPDVHMGHPHEWQVVDAECEVIARCDSKDEAEVVRNAIDLYNTTMERRRGDELDAWYESQRQGDPGGKEE